MAVSWLVFHITDRCQLNCRHCLRDPGASAVDMDLALVEKVLDQARELYGCSHVGLTGGEPTLHPRFAEIVDLVVDRGATWHMVTNAHSFAKRVLPVLDERPERACALTALDFSLDGADEATHDHIRGKGSFREVMQAITHCKVRRLPYMLQMVVNAYNRHQLKDFALRGAQLGADRISFAMLQPTGTYLDDEMYLPIDEWKRVRDEIAQLRDTMRIGISYTESFPSQQPFHNCQPFKSDILHVDYRGFLTLCCQHSGVPGEQTEADAIADLNTVSLIEAHRRMIDLVHRFQQQKLEAMGRGPLSEWDKSPCNYCMKHFGKPYWTETGTAGAVAERPRWRGAWAPEKHFGRLVKLTARQPVSSGK